MSGLTSLLSIAKVGLLAHQTNLQTIGHNISNVNTDGYSKQRVTLTPRTPTPTFIGHLGNGVDATEVTRAYDRFITTTLFSKESELSGLETKLSGLKTIDSLFNEVDENALSNLLEDFWKSWDDLANNAEGIPERTTLLQKSNLLIQGIKDKYQNLMKLSRDIDLNINSTIDDINRISRQLAELNVQIVAAEAGHHSANDLRDQRDVLLKKLSKLVNVRYFETDRGSYTILIGRGNPLVEDNKAWELKLLDGKVNWIGSNNQAVELTSEDIKHGELGGWMEIKENIKPHDPRELTSSVVNTSANQPIRLDNRFEDIDGVTVTGQFFIEYSGTDQNGNPITATYDSNVDVDGDGITGTIRDFATHIENAFGGPVQLQVSTTEDGRIMLKDMNPGDNPITFQIDNISGGIVGLKLGKFDNKYPLTYTEKLNLIAKQLIKTVNREHSQGAGLIPLQETTSHNVVLNTSQPLSSKSSGLEFSSDIQDGYFEIWLYDENGDVIDQDPATANINEPVKIQITAATTSLDSLAGDIDGISGLSAKVINGTLIIGLEGGTDVSGFAFGKDTSNVLMALGINSYFTGTGASDISLNKDLINDPRLIAAAKIQPGRVEQLSSINPVMDIERTFGLKIEAGDIRVELQDPSGNAIDSKLISITGDMSIKDIVSKINEIEGVTARIDGKKIHIEADNPNNLIYIDDNAGATDTNFLEFMGNGPGTFTGHEYENIWAIDRSFDPVSSYDTGVVNGTLTIQVYDSNGEPIDVDPATAGHQDLVISINPSSDSLASISQAINQSPYLRADITNGKLNIFVAGEAESFSILNDTSNLSEFIGISIDKGGILNPANNKNALAIRDLNHISIEDLNDATINEAYHGLVGEIGIKTRTTKLDHEFMTNTVRDLFARREDVSGVSLDEELSDLLKFQHAYTAAAKLIKTADELFLSLLQVK